MKPGNKRPRHVPAPVAFNLCCEESYWLVNAAGFRCGQTCYVHGSYRWDKVTCGHCGVIASELCSDQRRAPRPPQDRRKRKERR